MERKFKDEFFTRKQLESIAHVPIASVLRGLKEYRYCDDLVESCPFTGDQIHAYVVGYLRVKYIPIAAKEIQQGKEKYLKEYFYGQYCSGLDTDDELEVCFSEHTGQDSFQQFFNFTDFKAYCNKIGLPIKDKSEINYIESLEESTNLEIKTTKKVVYPPELQLAIDAFETLCLDQELLPKNDDIKNWLKAESKKLGITHTDSGKRLKGFSVKKLETISSIIKS